MKEIRLQLDFEHRFKILILIRLISKFKKQRGHINPIFSCKSLSFITMFKMLHFAYTLNCRTLHLHFADVNFSQKILIEAPLMLHSELISSIIQY